MRATRFIDRRDKAWLRARGLELVGAGQKRSSEPQAPLREGNGDQPCSCNREAHREHEKE